MINRKDITGVVLAGGRASRMGGKDKGLVELAGRPLIEHVLERLRPQVGELLINANRNIVTYSAYARVVSDSISDFAGPLAGMLTAMEHANTAYILTVPCDGPYLPDDLAARLSEALQAKQASVAVVHDGQRLQPVYALLDCGLQDSLRQYLLNGDRKIDLWFQSQAMVSVAFAEDDRLFININRPEELDSVEAEMDEAKP